MGYFQPLLPASQFTWDPPSDPALWLCLFFKGPGGEFAPAPAWLAGCGASQPIAGAGSETRRQLTSYQNLGPCLGPFRLHNKILQTGDLQTADTSHSPGGWRFESRVPTWSGEGPFPDGRHLLISSLIRRSSGVLWNLFYRSTNPIHEGLPFMTLSLSKASIC